MQEDAALIFRHEHPMRRPNSVVVSRRDLVIVERVRRVGTRDLRRLQETVNLALCTAIALMTANGIALVELPADDIERRNHARRLLLAYLAAASAAHILRLLNGEDQAAIRFQRLR